MRDDRSWDDPQYKKWRCDVYRRDGYACKFPGCNKKGFKSKIQAHHIKRWADFPELRFELSNGITLCKEHHILVTYKETEYEPLFINILRQITPATKAGSKAHNRANTKLKKLLLEEDNPNPEEA